MWKSRVENEHYSIIKIEFNAYSNASGYCLFFWIASAIAHVRDELYRAKNTAHFSIAAHCNYCDVTKK